MSKENLALANTIRQRRRRRKWSQQDLADRAGLSRTGVGAIEAGRLIPSTAAALALAAAFGCRVEDLFTLAGREASEWAWPPQRDPSRYWRAEVGSRQLLFPVEPGPLGMVPHDGVWRAGEFHDHPFAAPARTLVVACCDPAVGLLANEYARQTPFRMLPLTRSSGKALELLAAGLVHAAGLHLGDDQSSHGNQHAARAALDENFHLLRVTDWEEGVAVTPGIGAKEVAEVLVHDFRWVGREVGSGARQVFDEIVAGRITPEFLARDHRGVAQSISSGLAQAGVSVRLVCEEEGLDFLMVRRQAFELCLPESSSQDPRLQALVDVVRSAAYRRRLAELPGYQCRETGEITRCLKSEMSSDPYGSPG